MLITLYRAHYASDRLLVYMLLQSVIDIPVSTATVLRSKFRVYSLKHLIDFLKNV